MSDTAYNTLRRVVSHDIKSLFITCQYLQFQLGLRIIKYYHCINNCMHSLDTIATTNNVLIAMSYCFCTVLIPHNLMPLIPRLKLLFTSHSQNELMQYSTILHGTNHWEDGVRDVWDDEVMMFCIQQGTHFWIHN